MSYILDALKKADRDRRQARVPSLGTVHEIPRERRTVWPWVVAGMIVLNVAAAGAFVVWRAVPVTGPPPSVVTVPRPAMPGADAGLPAPPPVVVEEPEPAAPVTPPASGGSVRMPVKRADAPAREPDALKLEILIYSPNQAERAAYINGQRYVEGERVNARFVVERITNDSVVLASKDTRHVLRQR